MSSTTQKRQAQHKRDEHNTKETSTTQKRRAQHKRDEHNTKETSTTQKRQAQHKRDKHNTKECVFKINSKTRVLCGFTSSDGFL